MQITPKLNPALMFTVKEGTLCVFGIPHFFISWNEIGYQILDITASMDCERQPLSSHRRSPRLGMASGHWVKAGCSAISKITLESRRNLKNGLRVSCVGYARITEKVRPI